MTRDERAEQFDPRADRLAPVAKRAKHAAACRARMIGKPLTEREVEIAKKLCEAKPNKLVAEEMGLSPKTVSIHTYNLYSKLDVHSQSELMLKLNGPVDVKTSPYERDQSVDRILVRIIRIEGKIDALIAAMKGTYEIS